MAGIVSNIIQNSLSGFVTGAVTTVGGYAGDAVGGIGNLIENGGRAVGNTGINGTFNRVGESINAYGTAVRTATAPNAGGVAPVKKTDSTPKTGAKIGDKKALPSSGEKKALPAPKQMKALPAPPTKKEVSKPLDKPKSSYTSTGDSYKSTASSYSGPATKKAEEAKKPQIGANGQKKVVPEKRSLPAYKPATDANALKSKSFQTPASPKYPTANAPKPAIPGYSFGDKAVSKAGSVAGGYTSGYKPAIPGFGDKTGSKAPSVAGGGGNKTSANKPGPKPAIPGVGYGDKAASKAGSVAGSVAGGGPKFF